MKRIAWVFVGAFVAIGAMLPSARAQVAPTQVACGPRTAVVDHLQRRFAEVPVAIGLQSNGSVLEVFASSKSGTWTILVTVPGGVSCAIMDGEAWENQRKLADDPVS